MFNPRRINKIDIGNHGAGTFAFDAGVSNCITIKTANNAGGVSSVKCNGLFLSAISTLNDSAGWTHQIWALQDSPMGNVTLEIAGAGTIIWSAESLNGISTIATFPNAENHAEHNFANGLSQTDIQVDVTTTEDDCILIGLGGYRAGGITFMQPGSNTATISRNPPTGGEDLSFESSPIILGPAGTYHLDGTTGGGNVSFSISLLVCALAPGPDAVLPKRGSMFLVFD